MNHYRRSTNLSCPERELPNRLRLSVRDCPLNLRLNLSLPLLLSLPSHRKIIPVLHRHALGHMIDLVNANQPLRQFKHVIPQRNDDELSILRALFDVSRNDRHLDDLVSECLARNERHSSYIPEIQRSINLIHDVQRCRTINMQRKNQRQRAKRLLTTRQVADILPAFLRRHD